MFILLGMLAVAASDLLLLLERRDSGGFHEVHVHDGGRLQYMSLLISPPYHCPFVYLSRMIFRLDDAEDALYSLILSDIFIDYSSSLVRCSSTSGRAVEPSVA